MKVQIEISDGKWERINKYVEDKRFKDINDFMEQAAKLLLYAEDNKNNFEQFVKKF